MKGWWVGWYESGRRKAKALPTKALAEHFCYIKYTQLNSDLFTSTVAYDWIEIVNEYHHAKQVAKLVDDSIYEVLLTLRHFKRLADPNSSRDVTQQALDTFVLERGEEGQGDAEPCGRPILPSSQKATSHSGEIPDAPLEDSVGSHDWPSTR